jgi:hypothetical protein
VIVPSPTMSKEIFKVTTTLWGLCRRVVRGGELGNSHGCNYGNTDIYADTDVDEVAFTWADSPSVIVRSPS